MSDSTPSSAPAPSAADLAAAARAAAAQAAAEAAEATGAGRGGSARRRRGSRRGDAAVRRRRRPRRPTPAAPAPTLSEHAAQIVAGYTFAGPMLPVGALVEDDAPVPGAPVGIPLAMMNRHGLVAGATGTGKTKTLQVLTEGLSAAGVPVFVADIKGDLSGPRRARARRARSCWRARRASGRTGWPPRPRSSSSRLGGLGDGHRRSARPSPTSGRCCWPRCWA